MHWHQQSIDATLKHLDTSLSGLSAEEARIRLEKHGPNVLKEKAKKTLFMMFLDQFRDFMILVLIAAAVISGLVGELSDTIPIIVIVILNALIGFVQEYRAEKAMEALTAMAAHSAIVVREGLQQEIHASELVPGDIVVLDAGKIMPVDLRLVETAQLKAAEAALTGESVPVDKHPDQLRRGNKIVYQCIWKPPTGYHKVVAQMHGYSVSLKLDQLILELVGIAMFAGLVLAATKKREP